ncbi:hypothetical protein QL818_09495 [Bacillus altitudinis]|nr:hypothetical protein [Bacillus altitudinis]
MCKTILTGMIKKMRKTGTGLHKVARKRSRRLFLLLEVCEKLGLKKDRYYKLKKQATFKLSTALGII